MNSTFFYKIPMSMLFDMNQPSLSSVQLYCVGYLDESKDFIVQDLRTARGISILNDLSEEQKMHVDLWCNRIENKPIGHPITQQSRLKKRMAICWQRALRLFDVSLPTLGTIACMYLLFIVLHNHYQALKPAQTPPPTQCPTSATSKRNNSQEWARLIALSESMTFPIGGFTSHKTTP
jgi:hypothetical protein